VKYLKTYRLFEGSDPHMGSYYLGNSEIYQDIQDMLLELEDIGLICNTITGHNRIEIRISNGSPSGFYTFGFYRIQDVYLRMVRYLGGWQPRLIKVIDGSSRLKSLDELSFDNIKNMVDTDKKDISGGELSNEFRIIFTKL
jgi:hypothetical protein